ncbi:BMA-CDH-10 [Dirofilaria immitis]|nr:BMA-CDH-10 [Dirofilaria immitis]
MEMLKFGMIRNQPDDGVPGNFKKSDGSDHHHVLDKQSFQKDMAILSETMPEKIPLPALDKSLIIAAGKTTEEIAKEFREEETMNGTGIGISHTNNNNIQTPVSEMSTFLHSVADGDAVEKLVRDSNFMPVKENSNLFELRIENSLNFSTLSTPVSNLKTVTVTNHTIFNDLNYTTGKMPDGREILSVKAHDTFNSSIEFICMLPEVVFASPIYSAMIRSNRFQPGTDLSFSLKKRKEIKMPVFIFVPHFEHNSYEIFIPEGKNKDSTIVAIIYYLTYLSDVEVKFSIQSDPLQWFYLGEKETETNANRLIVAIKLMMHDGIDVDVRKTNNGQYKFQIKANQGSFETSANINVEVLTFATKGTSYSLDMTTISSATLSLVAEDFNRTKVLVDSEHHSAANSTDIPRNGSGVITVTVPNLEQAVTTHSSPDIKITQIEFEKDTLGITEESLVRENFAGTFQPTIHDTETIVNTAESTTEKGSIRPFILRESGIPITLPRNFENGDSTQFDINNLDVAYYSSVSPEEETSTVMEIREDALVTEIRQTYKDSEFNEYNNNFSMYNQERLPAAKKSTTAVVLSVENDNSFPSIPVGDGKSLQDEFGTSLMSMTTISVPENGDNTNNIHWSSFQDGKHFDENFQKSAQNFKINTGIKYNHITTEPIDLIIHESSKDAGTNTQSGNDDDTNYIKGYMNISAENDRHTSTYKNAIWKDHVDNIRSIINVDTTVTLSDVTEAVSINQNTYITAPQQTPVSLMDNIHMSSDNEINISGNQSDNKNFKIDKAQRIQLAGQQANNDERTVAAILHPEIIGTKTKTKVEWSEEDESLDNGFRINGMESQEINPNDIIVVSVNSSALEIIPHRMQPGKTVFLAVRDAEKLERDLLDDSVVLKVTASQRKHPSVTSSKIIKIMRDRNLRDEAPAFLSPEYDFHISEGSITGQKVGQMEAEFVDRREYGIITYQLIGPGSELFAVNGGTISVSCPSVLPCLDREQITAYHLLAIATNRNGLNSVPAIVRIHIDDRNDNGPILETLRNEITVFNGRLTKPFVVKVKDNDVAPHNINEISVDGTASAFISLEKVRDDIYYGRLWSLPVAGIYQLNITARDPDGNIPEQKITINVQVLNTVTRTHFKRAKYERTVNTEKLFKGNPILQPELENAPLDGLRFNWYRKRKYSTTIAAVNRTDDRLVTESVLILTVISDNHVKKLFARKLIVMTLRKDPAVSRQTVEVLPEHNKASIMINAISNSHGMIIIDMKRLQHIRMLQFNLSSKEDANDSAKVMLFLARSQLRWNMNVNDKHNQDLAIHGEIKLAENSPEEYTIISLPAYNPANGSKIMDLRLSGEMAEHFTVDGRSGDVQVVTPFDFEAMDPESHIFDLLLIAGEEPYDTIAVLRVEIIDIDDNPPKIAKSADDCGKFATWNSAFEVRISDPDYLYGKTGIFNYALSGNGAPNFQVKKMNDTIAVIVSPAADLDREKLRKCEYKIEAVENWPETMVLTYVHAEDNDKGLNADIRYSLSPTNHEYFEIDPVNGLIRAKKALVGLARAHPYDFSVVASDQGTPSLSANTAVSIHVLESTSLSRAGDDKGIHIVSPSVHFTLQLDEVWNTPANDRVYSIKAKIGGFNEQFGREIKYSITPVDNITDSGWFTIDMNSGDLFTLQELDHELQPAITSYLERGSGRTIRDLSAESRLNIEKHYILLAE